MSLSRDLEKLRIDTSGTKYTAPRSRSPSRSPVEGDRSPSPLGSPWQSQDDEFDEVRSEYSEAPPDLSGVDELVTTMRETLTGFNRALVTLSEQAAHVARIGPAVNAEWQIARLSKTLTQQDRSQTLRIQEMDDLVRNSVPAQMTEHLGGVVSEMVRQAIERRIRAGVERELDRAPPGSTIGELRDKLESHRKQLRDVRVALVNAEARRHNALIRSNNLQDPLRPLLPPSSVSTHGQTAPSSPSPLFPATLTALFGASTKTASSLMKEYGLEAEEGQGAREKNLNKFMGFIGVAFQMVPAPGTSVPSYGGLTPQTQPQPIIAHSHA